MAHGHNHGGASRGHQQDNTATEAGRRGVGWPGPLHTGHPPPEAALGHRGRRPSPRRRSAWSTRHDTSLPLVQEMAPRPGALRLLTEVQRPHNTDPGRWAEPHRLLPPTCFFKTLLHPRSTCQTPWSMSTGEGNDVGLRGDSAAHAPQTQRRAWTQQGWSSR